MGQFQKKIMKDGLIQYFQNPITSKEERALDAKFL